MTGKIAPQSTTESRDPRPRRAADVAADAALVQGLERLRDALLRRLEEIEAMAREQARSLEQDVSEREQELSGRVLQLEAALARIQAEAKRREQESQTVLQQLEADRRLLAEAWERLEQEQLDAPPVTAPAPAPAPAVDRTALPRPAAVDPAADVVTRSILQQFQTLQGDVRRNARERNGR